MAYTLYIVTVILYCIVQSIDDV